MSNDFIEKQTLEEFKEVLLSMERENLSKIKPDERKKMVSRIMKYYEALEGSKEDDNK